MTRASFFDYDPTIHGFRFITLTEESPTVSSSHGGEHEEGWSSTHVEWRLDGERVVCTIDTDGRDCDGRMSTHAVYSCPIAELAAREVYDHDTGDTLPFQAPNWTEGKSSQRDHSAEAAGY